MSYAPIGETRRIAADGTFKFNKKVYRALGLTKTKQRRRRHSVGVRPDGAVYLHDGNGWLADAVEVRPTDGPTDAVCQEMEMRDTDMGPALYIRIYTPSKARLTWDCVWEKFADSYPGKWAVQCFPPESDLVNDANIYHLFVLDTPPRGLNIKKD